MKSRGDLISREEALLWLNDRLGKSVHASLEVEKGDVSVSLLAVQGELRHWRDDYPGHAWDTHPREEITGLYSVGGENGSIDLTDVARRSFWMRPDGESLDVELAEDVWLEIVEQREIDPGELDNE